MCNMQCAIWTGFAVVTSDADDEDCDDDDDDGDVDDGDDDGPGKLSQARLERATRE
jgi:hypothetical protein